MTTTNATIPYAIGKLTLPNGISIFYREAGSRSNPTVLLLHGFPSSSHQFRNLIPLLSDKYHVVAPDYPGFGFTTVPPTLNYTYTFDNLANTISAFLTQKHITTYTPYIFDYGAPIGFRLMLQSPNAVKALITQNGNAYIAGFGQEFWAPIFALWNASTSQATQSAQQFLRDNILTYATTKYQYDTGSPDPSVIEPESYTLDAALLSRPGNADIQLALFKDYANNVKMYPAWHAWLREHQPKVLAVWGKNDPAFIPAGAEAYKTDVPAAEVHLLNGGHFLLETDLVEVAGYVRNFLGRSV